MGNEQIKIIFIFFNLVLGRGGFFPDSPAPAPSITSSAVFHAVLAGMTWRGSVVLCVESVLALWMQGQCLLCSSPPLAGTSCEQKKKYQMSVIS